MEHEGAAAPPFSTRSGRIFVSVLSVPSVTGQTVQSTRWARQMSSYRNTSSHRSQMSSAICSPEERRTTTNYLKITTSVTLAVIF